MSETRVSYRERVRYEDLLLFWLDRINQYLNFEEKETIVYKGLNIERAVRSIRVFYNMLPQVIRTEIDKRLGKPLLEYISYTTRFLWFPEKGVFYAYTVIPLDLVKDFEKEHKKGENPGAAVSLFLKYTNITLSRLEECIRVIIDILHDYGLLFREEYQFEAREE